MTAALTAVLRDVAQQQSVTRTSAPSAEWVLVDGVLRPVGADYFRIIGAVDADGDERLLIEQAESALVGLVVAPGPHGWRVLLNARAEPGLHGGAQFSTTVQSTPSNYEQRHGGAPTPYLDAVLGHRDDTEVLCDTQQYDWGQYYRGKVKRYTVVALPAEEPAPAPLVWVDEAALRALLRADRLTTLDLRCAAVALLTLAHPVEQGEESPMDDHATAPLTPRPLAELERWHVDDHGIHDRRDERSVGWFRTVTGTREVGQWTQPLMILRDDLVVRLPMRDRDGRPEVAVALATADGLEGRRLWSPAPSTGGRSVSLLRASAEGGRFFEHGVTLSLVEDATVADDAQWLTLDRAIALCRADRATSVELRLGVGLGVLHHETIRAR